MPFDGGVIVGYLAAALVKHIADRAVGGLLGQLRDRVRQRLGRAPLDDLARSPESRRVQARVAHAIERAAATDRAFSRDISSTQRELDRRGARRYIVNTINAPYGQVAVGSNALAVGRIDARMRHPNDMSHAPGWAKGLVVIGVLLAMGGFGLFGYTLFTYQEDFGSDFGTFPEGIKAAGVLFFAGAVLATIGSLVGGMSRDRN